MTMARMDVLRSNRSLSPERFIDDDELPTTVFARDERFPSGSMRAPARDHRWASPSMNGVTADEISRTIIERLVRDMPPLPPAADATKPLTLSKPSAAKAPNVFLSKPRGTDPMPPWVEREEPTKRVSLRRKRRSILPLFALALATAIGLGLWFDPAARAKVASDLAHAASRVGALLGTL